MYLDNDVLRTWVDWYRLLVATPPSMDRDLNWVSAGVSRCGGLVGVSNMKTGK